MKSKTHKADWTKEGKGGYWHSQRLLKLYRDAMALDQKIADAAQLAWPLDSVVFWEHGRHMRSGRVIDHMTYGRGGVRVETPTGARVWIETVKILGGQFGGDAIHRSPSEGTGT